MINVVPPMPESDKFRFILLFTAFIFIISSSCLAATYTSNPVFGNWSDGSSWVGGVAPSSASDVIIIVSGSNITVTGDATCAGITINAASTATSLSINGGVNLTVSGAVAISAATAAVTSNLAIGDGTLSCGSLAIAGSATANRISLVSIATGTINCTGNITFSGGSAQAQFMFTDNGIINIQGNLGGGGAFNTDGTGTVNFNGTTAQTAAGYEYNTINADNPVGLTLTGASSISNLNIGDVTPNSIFNDGGYVITAEGNQYLNLNSGTYNLGSSGAATVWPAWSGPTINTGTTIAYVSGVAQAVSAAPSYQYLTFSGAGKKAVADGTMVALDWTNNSPATVNSATITVSGNVNGTGAITTNNGGTINVAGNWTSTGTVTGTGYINFNGGNQSIEAAASQVFPNVYVNSSGTLSVSGNTTTLQFDSITLNSGTFDAGTATQINVTGDWINNQGSGAFNPESGTVSFTGSLAQNITGAAGDQTFYNVILFQTTASTLSTGASLTNFLTVNNYTQSKGSFNFSQLPTFNINGNLLLSAGTFTAGNINAGNMNLNIAGNWTNNSGAAAFVPSTSITTFTGSTTAIGGSAATTFYVLTIADGNSATLTGTAGITCTTLNVGYGSSGSLATGTEPLTVTGDASAPNDGLTINGGATLSTTSGTITDKWDFTNNGTFTAGTGTVILTPATSTTHYIYGNDPLFYNLTINSTSNSAVLDATNLGTLSVTNLLNLSAPVTFNSSNTLNVASVTIANANDVFNAGGQTNVSGNWTNNGSAAAFVPGMGLVTFNGSGAQALGGTAAAQDFYDIEIGNTGTLTISAPNISLGDNLTIDAGATLTAGAGTLININYQWINNGGTFNPGTGTVNFNNGGYYNNITGSLQDQTFYNLTVTNTDLWLDASGLNSLTVNGNFTMTAGGLNAPANMTVAGNVLLTAGTFFNPTTNLNVGGNWTNNGGTFDTRDCSCNAAVTFNGTGAQAIGGTATTQSFQDLVVNKPSGTLTNATVTNLTINDNLTLTAGTFSSALAKSNITINNSGSPSSFTFNGGTFNIGNATDTVYVNGPGAQTGGTISSTGPFYYYGQNQQVITGSYANLTFDDNNKTLSPGTIAISGIFTPGAGTGYTTTGNTISLTGNTSQAIPMFNFDGTATGTGYGNLTTTTAKILPAAFAVNKIFSYDNANTNLSLGATNLLLGDSGSIAGTPGPTHMVVINGTGRLIKAFNTGAQSYTYPIGLGSNYTPVTLSFNNITSAGQIGVLPAAGIDPNATAPPNPATNWLKKYWTLDANTTSIAFDYYTAGVTFLSSDYNTNLGAGAAGESTMGAMVWNGTSWLTNGVVTGRTALNPTASYITSLGDLTFATCTALANTADPANQYVCVSGTSSVTFAVGVSGTPSTYQWYQNGQPVVNTGIYSGAQTSQLTLTNATNTVSGDSFYCSVTGLCSGNFTSKSAVIITVDAKPSVVSDITATPATYHAGDTIVIAAIDTTLYPGMTYRFVEAFPQSGGFFEQVQNTTSDTLIVDDVAAYGTSIKSPGVTWLFVYANDACGEAFGGFYQISVIPATTHINPSTCNGDDGSISFPGLLPGGEYNINYDSNGVAQPQLTLFADSTTGTLTIPGLGGGTYSNIILQVLNVGSSSLSAPADPVTLTGTAIPSVSLVASDTTICPGLTATFTATAVNGGSAPVYNFFVNGASVQNGASNTYSTSALHNNDVITCLLTSNNSCALTDTATSAGITVTVQSGLTPAVSIAASDTNICAGVQVVVNATPTNGGNSPLYNFLVNGVSQQSGISPTYTSNTFHNHDIISCILTSNSACASPDTAGSNAVEIDVLPVSTYTLTQIICFGDSLDGYNATGTYTDTFTSVSGCDSIRFLNLTVRAADMDTLYQTICNGTSYLGYNQTGIYTNHFTDQNGCDSARTLNLTVSAFITSNLSAVICPDTNYYGHDATGTYVDTFSTGGGCDSIRTLNLTVLTASALDTTIMLSGCEGDTLNGYTASGNYVTHLTSVGGCDSIVTFQVTLYPVTPTPVIMQFGDTLVTAPGYTYQWFQNGLPVGSDTSILIINSSGTYTVFISAGSECGSTSAPFQAHGAGIQNIAQQVLFNVFPNPSAGIFNVSIENAVSQQPLELRIYDALGQLIMQTAVLVEKGKYIIPLNISNQPRGIYLVRAKQDNWEHSQPIILN